MPCWQGQRTKEKIKSKKFSPPDGGDKGLDTKKDHDISGPKKPYGLKFKNRSGTLLISGA